VKPVLPPEGLAALLLPETRITAAGAQAGIFSDHGTLLALLYITGVILSACFYLFASLRLLQLIIARGKSERIIAIDSPGNLCFSAFGYVFISRSIPEEDAGRMIAHERNHIGRMHHTDLLLAGLINIVQWFNPASYLLRRSLQKIHEYQADSECISHGEEVASYQRLLVSAVLNTRLSLISNTFSNSSLLKNRIIMMTKKKSGSISSLKILMAAPVAALLLFTFSCNEMRKDTAPPEPIDPTIGVFDSVLKDNVFNMPSEMPVFGTDAGKSMENLFLWINANLKYPQEAKEKGITGKVIITLIVDENGNIIQPEVVRSVDPLLDQAVIDMIKQSPKWQPGLYNGRPVKVKIALPVSFALK